MHSEDTILVDIAKDSLGCGVRIRHGGRSVMTDEKWRDGDGEAKMKGCKLKYPAQHERLRGFRKMLECRSN